MTTESIPPRWRSTRADAAAVRECARSHGVSDRSVRAWRRTNDPRWLKFLSARAGQHLGQLEAVALRTDLENSTPEEEEKSALRRFKLLEREITAAMDRGELSSIPTITRAAADSHKLLCACREATEAWKLRQKEIVTAAEVRQYSEQYVEAMVIAIKICRSKSPMRPTHPIQKPPARPCNGGWRIVSKTLLRRQRSHSNPATATRHSTIRP